MVRNFQTASCDRYGLLKEFAKKNRQNPTDAELFLWKHIKGKSLGVDFKRQHVIYDYIADFACLDKMLVIEVDGGYHFKDELIEYDAYRTECLEQYGYKVIRFKNENVLMDINNVIKEIKKELNI